MINSDTDSRCYPAYCTDGRCRDEMMLLAQSHRPVYSTSVPDGDYKPPPIDPLGKLWKWWKGFKDGDNRMCPECGLLVQGAIESKLNTVWTDLPRFFHLDSLQLGRLLNSRCSSDCADSMDGWPMQSLPD